MTKQQTALLASNHKIESSTKRIVVLISGSGTNMKSIMNHCLSSRSESETERGTPIINADIFAVISNRSDADGLAFAKELDIPTHVFLAANYSDRKIYDRALADKIDTYSPDLIVLAGFMRLLSEEFVQRFKGKLINIHPSLLPKFPGLDTHKRAIDAGETEHGTSVHFVDEGLDSGPVILRAKVPVFVNDTVEQLTERVKYQEHQIYPLVVKWFIDDRLILINNQAVLDGKVLEPSGYATE